MSAARFAIPSRLPRRLAKPLGAVVACGIVGCGGERQAVERPVSSRPSNIDLRWPEQQARGPGWRRARPVVVKVGQMPLAYKVERPQRVRVLDQSNNSIVAEAPVGERTIVRVEGTAGVVAGSQTLAAGPLPTGRRYAILVVPGGEKVTRTGTLQPAPARVGGGGR